MQGVPRAPGRVSAPANGGVAGRRRRQLQPGPGRGARGGGRIWLWQVHARPTALSPGKTHSWTSDIRRPQPFRAQRPAATSRPPARPDSAPGSLHVAQPAHAHRRGAERGLRDPPRPLPQGPAAGTLSESCWKWSACLEISLAATPTSSPAANVSGSGWPGRWP